MNTYCHSALKKLAHKKVEIFKTIFLLKLLTKFTENIHGRHDRGHKIEMILQDPHSQLGAATAGCSIDDGFQ